MSPEEFVRLLQTQRLSDSLHENFYSFVGNDDRNAKLKSDNLLQYLRRMQQLNPHILLVGEAPGYKGCKKTGIPFTSEYQILHDDFFKEGFEVLDRENPECENSAKVMWQTIGSARNLPLMWNIYPFHPSTKDGRNGKPNAEDIELGTKILTALLSMFDIENIYCVGRKSESALKNHKMFSHLVRGYVRHPSHGGAIICKNELEKILL